MSVLPVDGERAADPLLGRSLPRLWDEVVQPRGKHTSSFGRESTGDVLVREAVGRTPTSSAEREDRHLDLEAAFATNPQALAAIQNLIKFKKDNASRFGCRQEP
jgi:hypothetical protein